MTESKRALAEPTASAEPTTIHDALCPKRADGDLCFGLAYGNEGRP